MQQRKLKRELCETDSQAGGGYAGKTLIVGLVAGVLSNAGHTCNSVIIRI